MYRMLDREEIADAAKACRILTDASMTGVLSANRPAASRGYTTRCRKNFAAIGLKASCVRERKEGYGNAINLRLGFYDSVSGIPKIRCPYWTAAMIDGVFGNSKEFLWASPPLGSGGRSVDVWHYFVFCADDWRPLTEINPKLIKRRWIDYTRHCQRLAEEAARLVGRQH